MTKTVVTTDQAAHLWAHQSQHMARNASTSASFEGMVFYSYQTPVAMLHETRRGRVALVTSDGYSMTTKSKHLNAVRRSLHGMARTFHVPYVGAYGGRAPGRWDMNNPKAWHAGNVEHFLSEYEALAGRMLRAQSLSIESEAAMCSYLDGALQEARDYCDAFKLKCPVVDVADRARVIWGKRAARDARTLDPKYIAAREKARATAGERKARKEERERLARFEREAEARARFRAGGSPGYVRDATGGALLRYDAKDETVRTSLGAEFPADSARKLWPLIVAAKSAGREFVPTGLRTVELGSFRLTRIEPDGTVLAGCHRVAFGECAELARALGLSV